MCLSVKGHGACCLVPFCFSFAYFISHLVFALFCRARARDTSICMSQARKQQEPKQTAVPFRVRPGTTDWAFRRERRQTMVGLTFLVPGTFADIQVGYIRISFASPITSSLVPTFFFSRLVISLGFATCDDRLVRSGAQGVKASQSQPKPTGFLPRVCRRVASMHDTGRLVGSQCTGRTAMAI